MVQIAIYITRHKALEVMAYVIVYQVHQSN
jgi:hypothetical protein